MSHIGPADGEAECAELRSFLLDVFRCNPSECGFPPMTMAMEEFLRAKHTFQEFYFDLTETADEEGLSSAAKTDVAVCMRRMLKGMSRLARIRFVEVFREMHRSVGGGSLPDTRPIAKNVLSAYTTFWRELFLVGCVHGINNQKHRAATGTLSRVTAELGLTFFGPLLEELSTKHRNVVDAETRVRFTQVFDAFWRAIVVLFLQTPPRRFDTDYDVVTKFSQDLYSFLDARARPGEDVVVFIPRLLVASNSKSSSWVQTATGLVDPHCDDSAGPEEDELDDLPIPIVTTNRGDVGEGPSDLDSLVQLYSTEDLCNATNNFNESNLLGSGGYGLVYKGVINHVPVAVKVLGEDVMQGNEEYIREIKVLGRIRHPHIVTLYGTCKNNKSLVYEMLPGGNLETRLERGNCPWEARIRIAKETAIGLFYLHNCTPPIAHRDLKPANVLLDSNMNAKVGDMGLARVFDKSEDVYTATGEIKGTYHYIAPEYLHTGQCRTVCDVYSLGIIILQLVTNEEAGKVKSAVERALRDVCVDRIVDRRPGTGTWPREIVRPLLNLGLQCASIEPDLRPSLGLVVRELKALHAKAVSKMSQRVGMHRAEFEHVVTCPLTLSVFQDPVVADDGHTYERAHIQKWFAEGKGTSPLTNLRMSAQVKTNHMARAMVKIWVNSQEQSL
ncbi:hypothetical protein BSKO_07646 [Bryopsis sp. KO-2023]|nr:hypothetical protein BSKO_07646 [Bryopsis sp. KO-2023]